MRSINDLACELSGAFIKASVTTTTWFGGGVELQGKRIDVVFNRQYVATTPETQLAFVTVVYDGKPAPLVEAYVADDTKDNGHRLVDRKVALPDSTDVVSIVTEMFNSRF